MNNRELLKFVFLSLVFSLPSGATLWAKTANGNETVRYYLEAMSEQERKEILDKAIGKMHYFRYLKIDSMERSKGKQGPIVSIAATEPSSKMSIRFKVQKSISLVKLMEEPETKVGDAIAITGVIVSMDWRKRITEVNPVIVRSKDRLTPKEGKEFLYEIDSSATFYSYTGGDEPVNLTYADRDLVQYKDQYLTGNDSKSKKAWANFLLTEMAKREKERKAKALEAYKKYGLMPDDDELEPSTTSTNKQQAAAEESNIVDDPK